MREAISIEGTLLMLDDSTPHVAVPVQAIRDGKVIATTLSDDGGRYQFVNLKPGQYQLRCQVLGGYVYYRATDHALRFTFHDSQVAGSTIGEDVAHVLQIQDSKTLKNIDFRFAAFKKGSWKNYSYLDGLASDRVFAVYCDPDGVMWFGTRGGVSRYDGKEFVNLTTEDGLAHNDVNAIYSDTDGVIWFATEGGGVSGYDGAAWTSLDTRDGLAGSSVRSILQDSDGSLWFATGGGITRYRRSTTPPKVYIVSVTTDQTYRDLSAIPAFTPGTRVTIEYSSIDFKTLPEKRQYRCRVVEIPPNSPLERGETRGALKKGGTRGILQKRETKGISKKGRTGGVDSDWLKPTKAVLFDHTFDRPGTYVFEVQAIDRNLNYSEPASVKLQVVTDPRNHRITQLEGELAERERAEMQRMQQELEDAQQIQRSLLPKGPPRMAHYEIAGTSLPAKEVSGDFYDYISLGRDVGVVLADVTGKSVKAAMIAAMANGMLHAEVRERKDVWDSPRMILGQLNMGLRPRLIRGMFTAMSLGVLQVAEKRLIFSNAGMMYPIVKRGKEAWELELSGMPLGITDRAEYQDLSFDLEEGDFVVFYSDGVTEATNEAEEMYQTERLLGLIQQADPGLSAHEMVDLIVRDVTAFVGGEEASDDITIVGIRCKE